MVFQYALRLVQGEPAVTLRVRRIKDRARTIGKILDDVAAIWKNTDGEPKERERKLQDIGAKLFDELFPVPMQAHLWKHRAKVKDLIVYADEPFVPWELVHLKPPDGPRPDQAAVPGPERARALAAQQLPAPADPGARGAREVAVPGLPRPAVRAHRARARAAVPRGAVRRQPGHRHPDRRARPCCARASSTCCTSPATAPPTPATSSTRSCCCRGASVAARWSRSTSARRRSARTPSPQRERRSGRSSYSTPARSGRPASCSPRSAASPRPSSTPAPRRSSPACGRCTRSPRASSWRSSTRSSSPARRWPPPAPAHARQTRKAGDATWLAFVVYARPDAVLVRS